MKSRSVIISALMILLVLPSCRHKDDPVETSTYLSGVLSFTMPTYVLPGEELTLVPGGAVNPTGSVGYSWSTSWTSKTDTTKTETGTGDGSWTVTVPSAIGAYTIYCNAFASEYISLSATKDFYVIDPTYGETLTGVSYQVDSTVLEDPRDGGVYYLASTGDKVWTQNNLYYKESGVSYDYSPAVDALFGRLYTWEEAMEACPEGWHLPSDAEFAELAGSYVEGSAFESGQVFNEAAGVLMANASFLGDRMWTFWPNVNITDESKFSAIPIGYAVDYEGTLRFTGVKDYSVFWTSDEEEDFGIYRYIYVDKSNVFVGKGDKKSFRASVRCVKD